MKQEQSVDRRMRIMLLLVLGLLFMGMFLYLFFPIYDTNDDLTINRLVDGARGVQSAHIIFQNILLGYLYTWLYRLLPSLPWYGILQYAAIYFSLAAIGYCLLELFDGLRGWVLYLYVQLLMGYDCYVRIQFTKTAGLAACAGGALLLLALRRREDEDRLFLHVGGILLASLGFMYRAKQALPVIVLLAPAGMYILLSRQISMKQCLQKSLHFLAPLFLAFALLYGVDQAAYTSPLWRQYYAFNEARSALMDYGYPKFEENEEAFAELNITQDAYNMLKGITFADPEVFTTETLEKIKELSPAGTMFSLNQVIRFLQKVPEPLSRRHAAYLVYAALWIWLMAGRHGRREIGCILLELICFMGLYDYLFVQGRYLKERVDTPLLFAVGISILFMIDGGHLLNRNKMKKCLSALCREGIQLLLILAVLGGIMAWRDQGTFKYNWRHSEDTLSHRTRYADNRRHLAATAGDTEHFYLARLNTIDEDRSFEVFDTADADISANVLWLGGWTAYTEYYLYTMEKNGIENPLRAAVDNDRFILVDNKIEETLAYLSYYLGTEVTAVQVDLGDAESGSGSYAGYQLTTSDAG